MSGFEYGMNKFEYPAFLEWTETLIVDMNKFHQELFKRTGKLMVDHTTYNKEYEEYLWRKFELSNTFDDLTKAISFAETVLWQEYENGDEIFCYCTGSKKSGYKYIVTLTENNKPKGWRLVVL